MSTCEFFCLFVCFLFFCFVFVLCCFFGFFSNEEKFSYFPGYIYDLLDVIKNCTKFQLNPISTENFELKLFDAVVTLKFNQGHRKWYEWVKLNEYYHHAKFDSYHIYSVRENFNVKDFATYGHSAGRHAWH